LSALEKLDSYLQPIEYLLPRLQEYSIELYLGLIHGNNKSDTLTIIEAAERILGGFPIGVSTECGLGRVTPSTLDSALKMLAEVCNIHNPQPEVDTEDVNQRVD
jgi:hypothetical protein